MNWSTNEIIYTRWSWLVLAGKLVTKVLTRKLLDQVTKLCTNSINISTILKNVLNIYLFLINILKVLNVFVGFFIISI
jgi:hypothetical protein